MHATSRMGRVHVSQKMRPDWYFSGTYHEQQELHDHDRERSVEVENFARLCGCGKRHQQIGNNSSGCGFDGCRGDSFSARTLYERESVCCQVGGVGALRMPVSPKQPAQTAFHAPVDMMPPASTASSCVGRRTIEQFPTHLRQYLSEVYR